MIMGSKINSSGRTSRYRIRTKNESLDIVKPHNSSSFASHQSFLCTLNTHRPESVSSYAYTGLLRALASPKSVHIPNISNIPKAPGVRLDSLQCRIPIES